MRKPTMRAAIAFLYLRSYTGTNTRVVHRNIAGQKISYMYLHDNLIAQTTHDGSIHICMCGWPSAVTRERLNGLLSIAQGMYGDPSEIPPQITQRAGAQVYQYGPSPEAMDIDKTRTIVYSCPINY